MFVYQAEPRGLENPNSCSTLACPVPPGADMVGESGQRICKIQNVSGRRRICNKEGRGAGAGFAKICEIREFEADGPDKLAFTPGNFSKGRQASRLTGPTADEVRIDHQSQKPPRRLASISQASSRGR
jgi:hypothetical protein